MLETASRKRPDIDNASDAAVEEAWRDLAAIEMSKGCTLVTVARGSPHTRDLRVLCLAFLHDRLHCIYFAVKVSVLVFVRVL